MPSVQGTQEKSNGAERYNLNVASTAGFFQPRISNPWRLLRLKKKTRIVRIVLRPKDAIQREEFTLSYAAS